MITKIVLFFGTVTAIPIVGQIPTESTASRLAVGSTQAVLAIVLMAVSGALLKVFHVAQKDRDKDREQWEKRNEKFEALMIKNTEAMTKQSISSEQVATSSTQMATSVDRFTEAIKKCEK